MQKRGTTGSDPRPCCCPVATVHRTLPSRQHPCHPGSCVSQPSTTWPFPALLILPHGSQQNKTTTTKPHLYVLIFLANRRSSMDVFLKKSCLETATICDIHALPLESELYTSLLRILKTCCFNPLIDHRPQSANTPPPLPLCNLGILLLSECPWCIFSGNIFNKPIKIKF